MDALPDAASPLFVIGTGALDTAMDLRTAGYEVRRFECQNFSLFEVKAASPAGIVLDASIPIAIAIQICQGLKEDALFSHVPVLLLLRNSEDYLRVAVSGCRPELFLVEPFHLADLLAHVDEILRPVIGLSEDEEQSDGPHWSDLSPPKPFPSDDSLEPKERDA